MTPTAWAILFVAVCTAVCLLVLTLVRRSVTIQRLETHHEVAGFLIGIPTLRLGGIYLAMATLGFGEIIHLILLNWLGVTRGPLGIPAIPGPAVFGVDLATPARQYYVVLALVVVATVVVSRLVNSSFGEAIQAIREYEVALVLPVAAVLLRPSLLGSRAATAVVCSVPLLVAVAAWAINVPTTRLKVVTFTL